MLLTEYNEILREFNYEEAAKKKNDFLNKLDNLLKHGKIPRFFNKIYRHLANRFKKLSTHTKEINVDRTSNKCETFNSLSQIRHIKNNSKSPKSLVLRLASTMKTYFPNFRTLQKRKKYGTHP
jgi:hypothetical protein